jgi:hypothetical protein
MGYNLSEIRDCLQRSFNVVLHYTSRRQPIVCTKSCK